MARPLKYKTEYCEQIVKFFDYSITDDNGKVVEPKFLQDYAHSIGVTYVTLNAWAKRGETDPEFEEFSYAYKKAKEKMIGNIVKGGLLGLYNSGVTCFTLKNIAGWRDSTEVKTTGEVHHKHTVEVVDIEERADQLHTSRMSSAN